MFAKIVKFIIFAWQDIIFCVFMAIQEIDDTSFLVTLENRAVFKKDTLVQATIITHIIMNILVVLIAYVFTGLFMTRKESGYFGIITIYFICVYEFLCHVLKPGIVYLTPIV